MSTTTSTYRFTRHADEYAVTRPMEHLTAHLGSVRRTGKTWTARPASVEQGAHLYVTEHWTRANAAAALDAAHLAALAEDHGDDVTAEAAPAAAELTPGMYRVRVTVTNRDGVHTATEDMNPAAIELARSRPGWSVEILGESRVTIVEDIPLHCSECDTTAHVGSGEEEDAFWGVHGGVGVPCMAAVAPDPTPAVIRPIPVEMQRQLTGERQQVDRGTCGTCRTGCGHRFGEAPGCTHYGCLAADGATADTCPAAQAAITGARVGSDPRTVTGTPENIDARASARARGELAAQASLTFDESDRQAMTEAQLRATAGDALALF